VAYGVRRPQLSLTFPGSPPLFGTTANLKALANDKFSTKRDGLLGERILTLSSFLMNQLTVSGSSKDATHSRRFLVQMRKTIFHAEEGQGVATVTSVLAISTEVRVLDQRIPAQPPPATRQLARTVPFLPIILTPRQTPIRRQLSRNPACLATSPFLCTHYSG
jgi:hypothetical protein